ncbi:MAG: carboxypeptidase regulatory-like domain-containing protein [Gemmatimonadota bacterium]|nr:MAG: carboxypeptidase regulatory-like domain-containing protein [Gemmatimonadota bacterium]
MRGVFSTGPAARTAPGLRFPIALTVLLLLPPPPALAQPGTVSGRVIDLESGRPLPGASVALLTGTGRTVRGTTALAGGEFVLSGAAPSQCR